MIDKETIQQCRRLLFQEINQNMSLIGSIEYNHLCVAKGSLDVLSNMLEKSKINLCKKCGNPLYKFGTEKGYNLYKCLVCKDGK